MCTNQSSKIVVSEGFQVMVRQWHKLDSMKSSSTSDPGQKILCFRSYRYLSTFLYLSWGSRAPKTDRHKYLQREPSNGIAFSPFFSLLKSRLCVSPRTSRMVITSPSLRVPCNLSWFTFIVFSHFPGFALTLLALTPRPRHGKPSSLYPN